MGIQIGSFGKFFISNFNDQKVTLDQELGERTVAFRDLEDEERTYLINSHKKLFILRSNLPLIMVIFMIYEATVIYFGVQYIKNVGFDNAEVFLYLTLFPAGLLFVTLKKENNFYKDIGRPVVKTVGTLTTHEIVHRRSVEKYFTVENVRFDKSNNDMQTVNQIFGLFGKNQSFWPVRIEYSPFSTTIWQIKKRANHNNLWEVVYSRIFSVKTAINQPLANSSNQN